MSIVIRQPQTHSGPLTALGQAQNNRSYSQQEVST